IPAVVRYEGVVAPVIVETRRIPQEIEELLCSIGTSRSNTQAAVNGKIERTLGRPSGAVSASGRECCGHSASPRLHTLKHDRNRFSRSCPLLASRVYWRPRATSGLLPPHGNTIGYVPC